MPPKEQKSKISKATFYEMLAVAILFDLVSLIPILGTISDIGALLIFYIWYKIKGVSFSNPKRGASLILTAIIEAIPIIDMIPTWTFEVIYMYTLENKEVLLAKVAGAAGGVAGVSSVAGGALKLAGAKDAGNKLKETSQKARDLQNQIKTVQTNPREKFEDIKRPENEQVEKGLQKTKIEENSSDSTFGNQANIRNEKQTPFKRDMLR